jgi:hypothetical protein
MVHRVGREKDLYPVIPEVVPESCHRRIARKIQVSHRITPAGQAFLVGLKAGSVQGQLLLVETERHLLITKKPRGLHQIYPPILAQGWVGVEKLVG